MKWRRNFSDHRRELALLRLDAANLGEQSFRIRMIRLIEELRRRRALDDTPEIHDDDAIGDVLHDAQVMADEQVREVERRLQIHEQIEHLSLDRYVERGNRFVADDELGLDRERARNADPCTLPAGKLMRIATHQRRVEPDFIEHQADIFDLLFRRDQSMDDRCFADDVDNTHARIERRVRILEDHLHLELRASRGGGAHSLDRFAAP